MPLSHIRPFHTFFLIWQNPWSVELTVNIILLHSALHLIRYGYKYGEELCTSYKPCGQYISTSLSGSTPIVKCILVYVAAASENNFTWNLISENVCPNKFVVPKFYVQKNICPNNVWFKKICLDVFWPKLSGPNLTWPVLKDIKSNIHSQMM